MDLMTDRSRKVYDDVVEVSRNESELQASESFAKMSYGTLATPCLRNVILYTPLVPLATNSSHCRESTNR